MKRTLLSTASSLVLSAMVWMGTSGAADAATLSEAAQQVMQQPYDDGVGINPTNTLVPVKKPTPQPMPIEPISPTTSVSTPVVANPLVPANKPKKAVAYLSEDGNTFYDRNGNAYHKDGDIFYDHSGKKNNLTVDNKGRIRDAKGRVLGNVNPPKAPIKPITSLATASTKLPKTIASNSSSGLTYAINPNGVIYQNTPNGVSYAVGRYDAKSGEYFDRAGNPVVNDKVRAEMKQWVASANTHSEAPPVRKPIKPIASTPVKPIAALPPVSEKLPQPAYDNMPTKPIMSLPPQEINPLTIDEDGTISHQPLKPSKASPNQTVTIAVGGDSLVDAAGAQYVRDDDGQPGALFHAADGSGKTLRITQKGALNADGSVYSANVKQLPKPVVSNNPTAVTIELPAAGTVKKLANGFTVDSEGVIRNPNGMPIALIKDDGTFTDANGGAVTSAEASSIIGLFAKPAVEQAEDKAISSDEIYAKPATPNQKSPNTKNVGFIIKSDGGSTYYGGDGNKDLSEDLARIRGLKNKPTPNSAPSAGGSSVIRAEDGTLTKPTPATTPVTPVTTESAPISTTPGTSSYGTPTGGGGGKGGFYDTAIH